MEITVRRYHGEYELSSTLEVARPIEEVFAFFSEARNLERLTPDFLNFNIQSAPTRGLEDGSIIEYRLKVHGLPIFWRTRITGWSPPFFFRDEQLRGPYRYWIHEHSFEETDGGTRIKDFVRYQPLGGFITNSLFVQRDIEAIFRYRHKTLLELFTPE